MRAARVPCCVEGCKRLVRSGVARFCEQHRSRWRRLGDPRAQKVSKHDLKPFAREVRRFIRERPKPEAVEQALRETAAMLREHCLSNLAERERYTIRGPKAVQQAERLVAQVLGEADAVEVGTVLGALFLMRLREPRRWPSDRAFVFSVTRHFRKLTPLAYGSYYSRTGKVKQTYRDLSPATVVCMAELLVDAYSGFGGFIVRAARAEHARRSAIAAAFRAPVSVSECSASEPVLKESALESA